MPAKVNGGPKTQAQLSLAGDQVIADMHGVLAVGEKQALLQNESLPLISPDGQAAFEAKLRDGERVLRSDGGEFLGARVDGAMVGQEETLREAVEHHHAAQRVRQGCDQQ